MAKGHENLIPLNKRTKEEQRKIAKMGGDASAKARAEKKSSANRLLYLMTLPASERNKAKMVDLGITDPDLLDMGQQMYIKQFEKAMKGDTQAFLAIRDTIGDKPTNKTEVTGNIEQTIEINLIHGEHDPVTTEDDIT